MSRMAAETAIIIAHASGRVLVLPPETQWYLLDKVNAILLFTNTHLLYLSHTRQFLYFDSCKYLFLLLSSLDTYLATADTIYTFMFASYSL